MKEIIYNYDNLELKDINKEVKRSKILIINSNNEILLGFGNENYQLPGGHVEENETFEDCIIREVKEETGIDINLKTKKPFIVIKYMCKDYPDAGENTMYIANYYTIISNQKPDLTKINLTENEKEGMFELRYIHKDSIVEELNNSLINCTRKNAIMDTLEVINEFLKTSK